MYAVSIGTEHTEKKINVNATWITCEKARNLPHHNFSYLKHSIKLKSRKGVEGEAKLVKGIKGYKLLGIK